MSCLSFDCCCCCCRVCEERASDKYPHIVYKSTEGANKEPNFYTVPLEKIFDTEHTLLRQGSSEHTVLRQGSSAYSIHSQSKGSRPPITRQPAISSHAELQGSCDSSQSGGWWHRSVTLQKMPSDPSSKTDSFSAHSEDDQVDTSLLSFPVLEQSEVSPEDTCPTLQFSVFYDIQYSTLQIHLRRATNLSLVTYDRKEKAKNEKSKVFVIMYLYPHKGEIFESKPVQELRDPVFNEFFEFHVEGNISPNILVFRMYEGMKVSKGNFIGSVVLPLGEADLFGVITTMKIDKSGENLPGDSNGDLLLSLRYTPTIQLLEGRVVKVTNLHKQDVIGLADPYVKLYLLHKGVRQAKWKTSVKRNTLTPVFNESFQFDVSQMELADVALEAVVMDYDRFSRNDLVGEAFIGDHVLTASGRSHWAEVTSFPCVSVSRWHSILPNTSS